MTTHIAVAGVTVLAAAAQAATPDRTATIAISARVLPPCEGSACGTSPRVVGYRRADEPVFELAPAAGTQVLTITY